MSFISLVDLLEETDKLTDWYTLGVYLKMPSEDLKDIESRFASTAGLKRCKIELFTLWLQRNPDASWDQIAQALLKCDEIAMAERIRKFHLHTDQPSLPAAASMPPSQPPVKLVRLERDKVIKFRKIETRYAQLASSIKTSLDEKQVPLVKIRRFLEELLNRDRELSQATTIDDLFHLISPYYCFLNTAILGDIIDEFIGQPLRNELDEYERQLDDFKDSTSMALLEEIGPQCSPSAGALDQVTIKLTKCYQPVTIKRFQRLVEQIFEENSTALANITVKKGCISVAWLARRSAIPSLIFHAQDKTQFMRLVGVLRVSVGGIDILEQEEEEEEEEEDTFLSSALDRATRAECANAVVTLLDLEADPNSSDLTGVTPLMIACARGNIRIAILLLRAHANINEQNMNGDTALILACYSETPRDDLVRLLIQYGADISIKSSELERTAMIIAAERGHTSIVQLLLEEGAPVNTQDEEGITALMLASQHGHSETVRVLFAYGADANILAWSEEACQTALMLACFFRKLVCVDFLLASGADPNLCGIVQSPLNAACMVDYDQPMDLTILLKLLSAGANPNTQNTDYGNTALMCAAYHGYEEGVEVLLSAGANVNLQNSGGDTALHYAAEKGNLATCKMLIASGAQALLTDSNNNTPLSLAQQNGHHEVCEFLRSVMDSDPTATQDNIITKTVQDSSKPRKRSRRILPKRRRGFLPSIGQYIKDLLLPNRAIKYRHNNQAHETSTTDNK